MHSHSLRLAIAQTTSSNRHHDNIADVEKIVTQSVAKNAQMIALPEAVGLVNRDGRSAATMVKPIEKDPFLRACSRLAKNYNVWIQAGSTPIAGEDGRFRNRATMIDSSGTIVASYDKIHLFDVFLEGRAPSGESQRYKPGNQAVLVETPWGPMGLSICYDLRFPHLYRQYAKAGAVVAFIPSAFTVPTGRAHWEILLRARAIENGIWIVAAAQVGQHADGRRTYGHSLVINPWGEVICDLGGKYPDIAVIDLDMRLPYSMRKQIPSLQNERNFAFKKISIQ